MLAQRVCSEVAEVEEKNGVTASSLEHVNQMQLHKREFKIEGLKLIEPARHRDERGVFSELWSSSAYSQTGIIDNFVQDNYSFSKMTGTVRGLHMQLPPYGQGKLVQVLRGAIWDVVVDIRPDSSTFGMFEAVELSASNWLQLWIPSTLLHGYCTLEDQTEVLYKVTAPYHPASESGVHWRDPTLAIPWPVKAGDARLSERDIGLPMLEEAISRLTASGY